MAAPKGEKCARGYLFMQNNVGQVLQHPVRGHGKNA